MQVQAVFLAVVTIAVTVLEAKAQNFCNRTRLVSHKTLCRPCVSTMNRCPPRYYKKTSGQGLRDCKYLQKTGRQLWVPGCRHICERRIVDRQCCKGYWGRLCLACPGGPSNPCNGQGKCADGVRGTGNCACQPAFNGTACEMCASSRSYGPFCNQTCQCVNGMCNNGIQGDGTCFCQSGYHGALCNEVIPSCSTVKCHNKAICTERFGGQVNCTCMYGYEGDGFNCTVIDMCERGLSDCHRDSVCIFTGPRSYRCHCKTGFRGDGKVCSPVNPCQTRNGGCPEETTNCVYTGPGTRRCECIEGYQNFTEGSGCILTDLCPVNGSVCHKNANCTTIGPDQIKCTCMEGYAGDGRMCYGNVLEELKRANTEIPQLKGQLFKMISTLEYTYGDNITQHGPFTVFAPTDGAFYRNLDSDEMSALLANKTFSRQLMRQHLIPIQTQISDLSNDTVLYTLQGIRMVISVIQGSVRFKLQGTNGKVNLVKGDLQASNGLIHVIDGLLEKPPEVKGDEQTPLIDLLKNDGRYNRLESVLKMTQLTQVLSGPGPYTVFSPNNGAWAKLPPGALQHLMSPEGLPKLKSIAKAHIIQGREVSSMDLVNMGRLTGFGGVSVSVKITDEGQIQLNGNVNITQTDIPASNGIFHHISSVLVPETEEPLLPHRCDRKVYHFVRGRCGPCAGKLSCPSVTDTPEPDKRKGCRYWVRQGSRYTAMSGCYRRCNRTFTVKKCCPGFFGRQCYPCPGGFQNPCSGNGRCSDGMYGTGRCRCKPDFNGTICEFCSDPKKFGPSCEQNCTCLYGVCDNSIKGKGTCKTNTCKPNIVGTNCDQKKSTCFNKRCHAHAYCKVPLDWQIPHRLISRHPSLSFILKGWSRGMTGFCRCLDGYTGDGTTSCIAVDPCQQDNRGGCHIQAKCMYNGPGKNLCQCDIGWIGDGTYCYPGTKCFSSSICHQNATCSRDTRGQRHCLCNDNFHGNGTYCVPNNVCLQDNGGCHEKAKCEPTTPGERNCTCLPGYGGDGINCYGTLNLEVNKHPEMNQFSELLKRVAEEDDLLRDLKGNYTLLVPSNAAMLEFLGQNKSSFWTDEENIVTFIGYHLVPQALSEQDLKSMSPGKVTTITDDLFTLNITTRRQVLYINYAEVFKGDWLALNGYIHLISKVLEPYWIPSRRPAIDEVLGQTEDLSVFTGFAKATGLLTQLQDFESYTLFAPVNSSFNSSVTLWKKFSSRRFWLSYVVKKDLDIKKFKAGPLPNALEERPHQHFQEMIITSSRGQILVNGVPVLGEPLLTDYGRVYKLSKLFIPVINRCDRLKTIYTYGPCVKCSLPKVCPPGFSPERIRPDKRSCNYNRFGRDYKGCQILCQQRFLHKKCCKEYYGSECEECPGGAETPCNNHGYCQDGMHDTGACACFTNHTGSACENCLMPNGTSTPCKKIGINPCSIHNGGCGENAVCSLINEGSVGCICAEGYIGDGYSCRKVTTCDIRNGGCSEDATCSLIANDPGNVMCTCNNDTVGDGMVCNGVMYTTLRKMNSSAWFVQALETSDTLKKAVIRHLLKNPSTNLTMFIPVSPNKQKWSGYELERYVGVEELLLPVCNNTSLQVLMLDDSSTILTCSKDVWSANGTAVVKANILTVNGFIHLLQKPFSEERMHPKEPKKGEKVNSSLHQSLAVGFSVFAATAILLLIGFVVYRHAVLKHEFSLSALARKIERVRPQKKVVEDSPGGSMFENMVYDVEDDTVLIKQE